jgi:hypothetical protein
MVTITKWVDEIFKKEVFHRYHYKEKVYVTHNYELKLLLIYRVYYVIIEVTLDLLLKWKFDTYNVFDKISIFVLFSIQLYIA